MIHVTVTDMLIPAMQVEEADTVLALEPILPVQWLAHHRRALTPIERLMVRVVDEAVNDLRHGRVRIHCRHSREHGRTQRRLRIDAERYLFDCDAEVGYCFAFTAICAHFGWSMTAMRARLAHGTEPTARRIVRARTR
jgi:hypothetical protein